MKPTKENPIKPGWYWMWLDNRKFWVCVHVYITTAVRGAEAVFVVNPPRTEKCEDQKTWWIGPITEPVAPE